MDMVVVTAYENVSTLLVNKIVNFIYRNQIETKDNIEAILKSVEYSLSPYKYQGGFILLLQNNNAIIGAVVVNKTNMDGYRPRNLLTHIAFEPINTQRDIDKKLIKKAVELSMGDLAYSVSIDSPLINLFEEVGFEKNYFEMRLKK